MNLVLFVLVLRGIPHKVCMKMSSKKALALASAFFGHEGNYLLVGESKCNNLHFEKGLFVLLPTFFAFYQSHARMM